MYSSTITTPQTQIVALPLSEEAQASNTGVRYSDFISEDLNIVPCPRFDHFEPSGDTLRSFTKADISQLQSKIKECNKFRSEVSSEDIYNKFSSYGDQARELPTALYEQLTHLSRIVTVLGDTAFTSSVNFDARYLADISAQVLMALKLISLEPSMTNLTLVFTSVLMKLNLSKDTLTQCIDFIKDALHLAISSISSIGYKSESSVSQMVTIFKNMCGSATELIEDQVIDIVLTFLAKLVSFWMVLSGGFAEDDFEVSNLPKIVSKMREILTQGGDLIECLAGAYEWVVENFTTFIKGDFSALFFGKAETSAYESRISKAKKIYPLVVSGSEDVLKEEYGHTFVSYDSEIVDLIKMGDRMMKKAKCAQKPALKRMIDEMREVQVDRRIKQAQVQTKVTAMGVCFVGGSGVGKSLLMDQTSRTIICAAGETPTSDKIVTGQMSDKFDSNEMPHHLSLQYDDVSNNSQNENFDKLLNGVNSQARPFLKAAVEEKGVMFPGNLACVISTNVPGMNAKGVSACADSLGRRFLHICTEIKPDLVREICVPGTKRVDPPRATRNGSARMDIWKFTVYEFISFDKPDEGFEDPTVCEWGGMHVRSLKWCDKPLEDQTFWDLALFLKTRAKKHFASQKTIIENMLLKQQDVFCAECCIPSTLCACNVKSEFICGSVDTGIVTLINQYSTFTSAFSSCWNMVKIRAMISLTLTLAPVNYKICFYMGGIFGLLFASIFGLSFVETVMFTVLFSLCYTLLLVYLAWWKVHKDMATRYGVISQLAEDSIESMRLHRLKIFAGAAMVSFAYLLYRSFRPRSEQSSYREALPENIRSAFARSEKARTTPIDNILPHMKRDLGMITITVDGRTSSCLAFPIEANCYVTVGHVIPKQGDFEIKITHENSLTPTVAKQKLNSNHVYRFPDKDLVLIQVPSAVPRKGYRDYLLGRDTPRGSQAVHLVSLRMEDSTRYVSTTRMEPGWGLLSSTVKTDKVTLVKPYKYVAPMGTADGMCGSLIVDYAKAIIYGFHVAGNGKVGLCDTITRVEVDLALSHFKGFLPLNQGDMQLGSNSLEKGLGFITLEVGDPEHDKPVSDHNCVVEGVLPGASATFKDPYRLHPFKDAIREQFGSPLFKPPQGLNDPIHKRKALTKLTSPNQEFSLQELEFAAGDYKKPIIDLIGKMPSATKSDLSRVLTYQEALDGLVDDALNGIDNSTSVGFPFRGKKKDFLEVDPLDPNIPLTPRELKECKGVDMMDEVKEMENRYKSNITCRPLFKCSMKTNELLTVTKKKARIFMGSNFPFLIVCRKYLAPVIRMMSENKLLFESAKGINMDSVEAEDLYNFLNIEDGEKVVALDYSAFDQTMSAQASTTAAGIMVDIMRELGCTEEHIQIVRGILTDITYPTLHFFGTILQLANSDPSGNPITTEVNGVVNSLYLRIFFFRIYPLLINKVSYRKAIKTATYGDDNINAVPEKYSKFNGVNIVAEGVKVGLKITMADKDAEITEFSNLHDSDFLKRKFRLCPDLGRIRAPLLKESIEKSIHWMKKTSPDPPEILFAQNVDGMLRKSSQHGRVYFDEIYSKLHIIAQTHDVLSLCKWWTYDELIEHDKLNYYDHHRHLISPEGRSDRQIVADFLSEAKKTKKTGMFGLLCTLASVALMSTAVTIASTEAVRWFDDGGSNRLITRLADLIRRFKFSVEDIRAEYIGVPYQLGQTGGLAEELNIPVWLAEIVASMCVTPEESGFKSESFTSGPQFTQKKGLISLCMMKIFEWIIALIPFIQTGRFMELGLDPTVFFRFLGFCAAFHTFLPETCVPSLKQGLWSRLGHGLRTTFVNMWLRQSNDIIREQPYCVLLEGGAGVGKTTCAIALVKSMCRGMNISRSDIIVLNESDEFQSELRSNHKVIIIDDLANTSMMYTTDSPVRRVIDIVNNVPRRALSPDVELKGNVKIQPILVIITTNCHANMLAVYTACDDSLYRRWQRYIVSLKKNHIFNLTRLDTSGWLFRFCETQPSVNATKSYTFTRYVPWGKPDKEFSDVATELRQKFLAHREDQAKLIKMVNNHFDIPDGKFKSEGKDWDLALLDKLKDEDLTAENFMEKFLAAKEQQLDEHSAEAFDNVPVSMRPLPPPTTWWSWLKTQLKWETFRSEAHRAATLSHSELVSLAKVGKEIVRRNVPVIAYTDYVIFLDRPRTVAFTTRSGPTAFSKSSFIFDYDGEVEFTQLPNFVSVERWGRIFFVPSDDDILDDNEVDLASPLRLTHSVTWNNAHVSKIRTRQSDRLTNSEIDSMTRVRNTVEFYKVPIVVFADFVFIISLPQKVVFTTRAGLASFSRSEYLFSNERFIDFTQMPNYVTPECWKEFYSTLGFTSEAKSEPTVTFDAAYVPYTKLDMYIAVLGKTKLTKICADHMDGKVKGYIKDSLMDSYTVSHEVFESLDGYIDGRMRLFASLGSTTMCPSPKENRSQSCAHNQLSFLYPEATLVAREMKFAGVSTDLVYTLDNPAACSSVAKVASLIVVEAKTSGQGAVDEQVRVRVRAFRMFGFINVTGYSYTSNTDKLTEIISL